LFRRRKGKQRLKQREVRRSKSIETSTELNYSYHAEEEKPYDNNEEIYKKNQVEIRSSSSSKIRRNVYESSSYEQISIVYKYFKKTVVESLEFSSIQQWRASRNRQYNGAYALLEAEEERTRHISYLRKILKSTRFAKRKSYITMDLLRKSPEKSKIYHIENQEKRYTRKQRSYSYKRTQRRRKEFSCEPKAYVQK
jgi:hypothetical protein